MVSRKVNKSCGGELDDNVVAGVEEKEPTITPHLRTAKSKKTIVRVAKRHSQETKVQILSTL